MTAHTLIYMCLCLQMGTEWSSVVDKCCRGHYQPLLLLYANSNDSSISMETAPRSTVMVNSDYCFNQNNGGTFLQDPSCGQVCRLFHSHKCTAQDIHLHLNAKGVQFIHWIIIIILIMLFFLVVPYKGVIPTSSCGTSAVTFSTAPYQQLFCLHFISLFTFLTSS